MKQNQGLVNLDTAIPQHNILTAVPHPVVVANVNYNNVERALQSRDAELSRLESEELNLFYEKDGEIFYSGEHDVNYSKKSSYGANHNKKKRSNSFTYLSNEKSALINEKLSTRYYSTKVQNSQNNANNNLRATPITPPTSPPVEKHHSLEKSGAKEQTDKGAVPEALLDRLKDVRLDDSIPAWETDLEPCLNKEAFLETQSKLIEDCMKNKNYNQVNAIYKSLIRNEIVPPLSLFEQVLTSICRRDLDQNNIDNQMFELLNCYQDIIQNKLKPSAEIYHLVVGSLLSGSIRAFELHNTNGLDFFKIAIDLFFASNLNKNKSFDHEFLDNLLLAINLYPGHIKYGYIKNFIDSNVKYSKNEIYYISLISYAKMLNEHEAVKDLYQDFRSELLKNMQLVEHQYEVYSVVVSAFAETGSLSLATKLLDKLLVDLQAKDGHNKNVSLVISNFLISVGKINSEKAYKLLMEFSKLKWVPEFSYEFYLVMIANCLNTNWPLVKRIYNYIFPMKTSFNTTKNDNKIKNYLLYPSGLESMPSTILTYALRQKDDELIMKLVEESNVKKTTFQRGLYPYIFSYFQSIGCPEPYLLRFVNIHGSALSTDSKPLVFEFLNALVENYQSQPILKKVSEMPFFKSACEAFTLENASAVNYAGFIVCFQTLWKTPQLIQDYSYNLELHGIAVSRLYDLDTYYLDIQNEMLLDFKKQMAERFQKLCVNYKRIHLDANKISPVAIQAMKMVDLSEDTVAYFQHPGDWDKSYPLSLGPVLRNSKRTGFKQYERLSEDGYKFDYDTFSELIHQKYITSDVITKTINLCPDKETLKYISNCIVVKCPKNLLEEEVIQHQLFSKILENLTDKSLSKLALNCENIRNFINAVGFPDRFKSITSQAEYKGATAVIFAALFRAKDYKSVIMFNEICPCLDISLILKSFIRLGDYDNYLSQEARFKDSMSPAALGVIRSEYLINQKKFEDAMLLLKSFPDVIDHQTYDKYSFALFLSSFSGTPVDVDFQIENTLQLANVLSAQHSFHNMIHCYESMTKGKEFSQDLKLNFGIKMEITQQILNNIEDSMQFLDLNDTSIIENYYSKLENYMRFRGYLKTITFTEDQMLQLLNIWQKINPILVDNLFNNIVESVCLNNAVKVINFNDNGSFNVSKTSLMVLLDSISAIYKSEGLSDHHSKVESFKDIIDSSMH